MTDWFAASLKFQRQRLEANRASLAVGGKLVGAGERIVAMQAASNRIAEANLAAYAAWAKLWGIG